MTEQNNETFDKLIESIADHSDSDAINDQTVVDLKQDLDTLEEQIQGPPPMPGFENEEECLRATKLVEAWGIPSEGREANVKDRQFESNRQLGAYLIGRKLGEGGMGAVYEAMHAKLEKYVALKILPADRLQDQNAVSRFEREMVAVGKLDHENIVRATDAGEIDGTHFLVMELVDGLDLSSLQKNVGEVSVADACELIRQAAQGLTHCHKYGMVHRDIKPSNLMLATTGDGKAIVKILDLGLARLEDALGGSIREITSTGQVMGTLEYMAPEQGLETRGTDNRADIYSLGTTLFKLLAGRPPFLMSEFGSPLKMMMTKTKEETPSVSVFRNDVPSELAELISKLTAKDPDQRINDPSDVAKALEPFAQGADLSSLLETGNRLDARSYEEQSEMGTKEHLTAGSVDTSPKMSPWEIEPDESTETHIGEPKLPQKDSNEISIKVAPKKQRQGIPSIPRVPMMIGAGLLAIGLIIWSITLLIQTEHGTIVVEIDDPEGLIQVDIDGESVTITDETDGKPITIKSDVGKLNIRRGDLAFSTEEFQLSRKGRNVVTVRFADNKVEVVKDNNVIGSKTAKTYALSFDGKSGIVDCGNKGSLNFKGDQLTIEAFVFPTENKIGNAALIAGKSENHKNDYDIALIGLRPEFAIFNGKKELLLTSKTEVALNKWSHIAGVYDGKTAKLFINGKLMDSANYQGKIAGTEKSFMIGGRRESGTLIPGRIRGVRVSGNVRYRNDFKALSSDHRFTPDEHTLALFHLDEGKGKVVKDSSKHGHKGTIAGKYSWVGYNDISFDEEKKVANIQPKPAPQSPRVQPESLRKLALHFNEESKVTLANLKIDQPKNFTVELWATPTATEKKHYSCLIDNIDYSPPHEFGKGFAIQQRTDGNGGNSYWGAWAGSGRSLKSPESMWNANRPFHLALQNTGQELQFFLNGQLVDKVEKESAFQTSSKNILIGNGFHGFIEEVRISKTARYTKSFSPQKRFVSDDQTIALYHCDEGGGSLLKDSSGNGHNGRIIKAEWINPTRPSQAQD